MFLFGHQRHSEYKPLHLDECGACNAAKKELAISQEDEASQLSESENTRHRFQNPRYGSTASALFLVGVVVLIATLLFLVCHAALPDPMDSLHSHVRNASTLPPGMQGSDAHLVSDNKSSSGDRCVQWQSAERQYTLEGFRRHSDKNPAAEFLLKDPCGHSAAEAKTRGCRFSMLTYAWLPSQCHDEDIEAEYKNYTKWKLWAHPNRTGEMTWDEVAKGEHEPVMVTWEQHQRHCIDMLRKFYRVIARRHGSLLSVDSYLSLQHHMDHCADAASDRQRPPQELNSVQWLRFPDCGLIRWKEDTL